jgi:imidazolonepropionase
MPDRERLWINANLATMADAAGYGEIRAGALAAAGGHITWVGPMAALPDELARRAADVYDLDGRWVTPGLIDCHTHLVYGGSRAAEFEQRLEGASYQELLAAGGGILSTVRATRAATEDELVAAAERRLAALRRDGVTTVEIKSGYGLDTATELKMLRVARRLAEGRNVDVLATFLGAHALPPEFAGRRSEYIDLVCGEMLPAVAAAGLADAVDGFCEGIAFTPGEIARVFDRAREFGLPVKLHADQLSDLGGAALAARYRALSADHLECASAQGIEAMAKIGTVAVLLPGAFYFLGETRVPPVAALREAGVPMAIASDCNPGSSPVQSLLLMLSMACRFFGLTPHEALAGVTRNAARALGLTEDRGTLETGRRADLAIWDIDSPVDLAYAIGARPCTGIVKDGKPLPLT